MADVSRGTSSRDLLVLASGHRLPTLNEQLMWAPYDTALVDASGPCVIIHWPGFANKTEFSALQGAALVYFALPLPSEAQPKP